MSKNKPRGPLYIRRIANFFSMLGGAALAIIAMKGIGGDTDDWLGFAGSALGAAIAIWAAVASIRIAEERQYARRILVVSALLQDARRNIDRLKRNQASLSKGEEMPRETRTLLHSVSVTLSAALEVADHLKVESAAIARVAAGLKLAQHWLDDGVRLGSDFGNVWWDRAAQTVGRLDSLIDGAIKTLGSGEIIEAREKD